MSCVEEVPELKKRVEEALGSLPAGLRKEALTHVSFSNEAGGKLPSNERLEFLGDAVLYLTTASLLFDRYRGYSEGELTRMRASLVSGQNLAALASEAGLGDHLYLGKGEEASGGRSRPSLLEGAFEALVGAIFLDQGFEAAAKFVKECVCRDDVFGDRLQSAGVPLDPKSKIQEIAQRTPGTRVEYAVTKVSGPRHLPIYEVACYLGGVEVSRGEGTTKKAAEEDAAAKYLDERDVSMADPG